MRERLVQVYIDNSTTIITQPCKSIAPSSLPTCKHSLLVINSRYNLSRYRQYTHNNKKQIIINWVYQYRENTQSILIFSSTRICYYYLSNEKIIEYSLLLMIIIRFLFFFFNCKLLTFFFLFEKKILEN